ncbi:MAG: hypothetical protein HUU10_04355 [Bacteroidetes bacterium]|nr:hypothetical protein [Bacteroidota bacterium]
MSTRTQILTVIYLFTVLTRLVFLWNDFGMMIFIPETIVVVLTVVMIILTGIGFYWVCMDAPAPWEYDE